MNKFKNKIEEKKAQRVPQLFRKISQEYCKALIIQGIDLEEYAAMYIYINPYKIGLGKRLSLGSVL